MRAAAGHGEQPLIRQLADSKAKLIKGSTGLVRGPFRRGLCFAARDGRESIGESLKRFSRRVSRAAEPDRLQLDAAYAAGDPPIYSARVSWTSVPPHWPKPSGLGRGKERF